MKKLLSLLVACIIVVGLSGCGKNDSAKYIDSVSDDGIEYTVTLTSDCDWNGMSRSKRVEIADAARELCLEKRGGQESGLVMFGFTHDGELAFNNFKVFENGNPDG